MQVKLKIPTSLSEVTIGKFIAIQKIFSEPKPDVYGDIEWEITQNVKAIAELTGASVEDIERLTSQQLKAVMAKLSFLTEPKFSNKVQDKVKIAGKWYKANLLINEITSAQFIDLSTFIKDPINNLHKVMASVYLPTKRNWMGRRVAMPYTGVGHDQRALLFKHNMSVEVAYPCALFFYQVASKSKDAIETYSEAQVALRLKELSHMLSKHLPSSQTIGDGIPPLTA